MNYETVSVRLPIEKNVDFYEKFILQYSLFESSLFFTRELLLDKNDIYIMEFFNKIHGHFNEYQELNMHFLCAGIEASFIQEKEPRGLWIDRFYVELANKVFTPSQLIEYFINANEYALLYSVFEGTLKTEFTNSGVLGEGKFMSEEKMLPFLYVYLDKYDYKYRFFEQLKKRSLINGEIELENLWNYFTVLRHLYTHASGIVTDNWKQKYKDRYEKIKSMIFSKEGLILDLEYSFPKYETIEIGKMIYLQKDLINIFRNFVVSIMESLYCCFI